MSSRKIWSIPIAALALVLMLVGAMAVTGIVQAQETPSAPEAMSASVDGNTSAVGDDTTIATVEVADLDADDVIVARNLFDADGVTANTVFEIDASSVVTFNGDPNLETLADDAKVDSYTVIVEHVIDLDNTADGTDGDGTLNNDPDLTLRTTLTVYVVRVETPLAFQYQDWLPGGQLSVIGRDLDDDPVVFEVTGVDPAAEVTVVDTNDSVELRADGNEISAWVQAMPAAATFTGTVTVDPDAEATGDEVTVTITGNAAAIPALVVTETEGSAGTFYVKDDVADEHPVGTISLTAGAATDETLDYLIVGNGADTFAIADDGTISVTDAMNLDAGDSHDLNITVNGDAGLANRTTSTNATIVVTASNQAPTIVESGPFPVPENSDDPAIMLTEGAEIGTVVAIPNDNESLTYSFPDDETDFEIDGETGAITAARDIPPPDDGSDFEKTVTVTVSDGVDANTQTADVEITVDVNDPVMGITDAAALPTGVTYNATDDVYEVAVSEPAIIGDRNVALLDLSSIVMGSDDSDDDVSYALAMDPAPNSNEIELFNSQVSLDDVPAPAAGENSIDLTFTVMVDDDYNNDAAGSADATLSFMITLMVVAPPDLQYPTIDIAFDEDVAVNTVVGSAAGHVTNGTDVTYALVGGSADFAANFSVDSATGEIRVIAAQDYESVNSRSLAITVTGADNKTIGYVNVNVMIGNVNEAPTITGGAVAYVAENAQNGDAVMTSHLEAAVAYGITASDPESDSLTYSIMGSDASDVPFDVSSGGMVTILGNNQLDHEAMPSYDVVITADDGALTATLDVTINVGNTNEAPYFIDSEGNLLTEGHPSLSIDVPEDTGISTVIADFDAVDPDGEDVLDYYLLNQDDSSHFALDSLNGALTIARVLDYEVQSLHEVQVNVRDTGQAEAEVELTVNVTNVNDNPPEFDSAPATNLSVPENTARGTVLANYSATDADGQDVTYSLSGPDAKSFMISDTGDLMTLESLDADRQVPCGPAGCSVMVIATDVENDSVIERGDQRSVSETVSVTVLNQEDSVSTLSVSKANPVPGTTMGNPMSALAGTKTTMEGQTAVMERPGDLPATVGDAPMNFVDSDWANWGTVLRIEITAESPDANCGDNGNQCVILTVNSDSGDDTLHLRAYRSASQEDKFVAAVMLVEYDANSTDDDSVNGVFMHDDGMGVPRLSVDEEDEVEIEFGNLRASVDVENEAPEIGNFNPAHEMAFDDADVDYTFTITDANSGLPEPEDLPDRNGDGDYMPVVALISKARNTSDGMVGQCELIDTSKVEDEAVLDASTHIHETDALYCPGSKQEGEYVASDSAGGTWGFAPIRDDKDFDEIDDGYDVETTIVLTENQTYYVTFIVCDNAGNCAYYDPDGNDDEEELAEITVDTIEPEFVESRTGLTWDSTDNEYDDNRKFIQLIFNDLTTLNPATVEVDDFVVEGHSIKDVHVFENPDDDDVVWADSGRYAVKSPVNRRGEMRYRDLENMVFLELEDELLADETPEVTIVPNGIEDGAGNEQDGDGVGADGDEADDWISPEFTIVSITSTRVTSQDEVLAGDDDEVTVVVTSDERLDATRPEVTVTYVNAPSGSVDTKGTDPCRKDGDTDNEDDWTGKRDRGEIVNGNDCQDSGKAAGDEINNTVEKVSNTEWIVTITEPDETGYYSFRISGKDRSSQENPGSEGIAPADIVTDFFDSDGDVNVDDAVFFEGDKNLGKPNVRVSGVVVTDDEPEVEFRSPLFVELDFTKNHWGEADCSGEDDSDNVSANCMNENSEYAEDNFDDVVITMFELDGVDMTDSVKTTDDQTFLVSLENISVGDHTFKIQAMDQAGNMLDDVLEIDFEVEDRSPFELRLNPGWNLVSLPGEPSDSAIGGVFGPGVEVRTVYTYDPVVPGGWMVAVRETLDSDWQGDLTEISGQRGYWVLSDAIQDWEVSIPRLAGGAAGTGTPIQPPSIPLYAGWNLIPVTDVTGNSLDGGATISANAYLQGLNDGIEAARVLGFNTIKNEWSTIDAESPSSTLMIGSGYWVFVREATILVPGQ